MKTNGNNKKGFTLIELLVVISIIALLLAILMPSLQKAKFHAQRVVCLNNIKSQYLPQLMYAGDNDGKFAPHYDYWPNYVRSAQAIGSGFLREAMDSYIDAPEILLCPLQKRMGSAWADLEWYMSDMGGYGGWDSHVNTPDGQPASASLTGYLWTANYEPVWGAIQFKFSSLATLSNTNEPEWPKKDSDCNASKAFITHDIARFGNVGGNTWWYDHGHGGSIEPIRDASAVLGEASKSSDNPVGYADGHTEWTKRSQLKPRVKIGDTVFYY